MSRVVASILPILHSYGLQEEPELWGHGSWKKIRCPFHDDRTASAQTDGVGFRCFTEDLFYPSAIALLMEREAMSFDDAKRRVAEVSGTSDIAVRESTRAGSFLPRGATHRNIDGSFLSSRFR